MNVTRMKRAALAASVCIAFGGTLFWGCGEDELLSTDSGSSGSSQPATLSLENAGMLNAMRVQEAHTPSLLGISGVVGTAVTATDRGEPAVLILTERPLNGLPLMLDGIPVIVEVSGKIVAMKGGGGGVSHTAQQTPPIQLGCSGGPALDSANGYCCGGTLGALVSQGAQQFILSNSHVFAGDVVNGGNGRVSSIGDDIQQPGLIDKNCSTAGVNVVADLSSGTTLYPPTSTPNVDCSIAQVRAGMVRSDGAILEVGTISATTTGAAVNQAVKKSGRTTGLTRSTVSGLNATVNVGYSNECGGGSFTKTFTGQILIANRRSGFLNSGDSGSLMVEDVTTNPRAVGLLFAGSSTIAIANPIGTVLSHLGVSLVGQ